MAEFLYEIDTPTGVAGGSLQAESFADAEHRLAGLVPTARVVGELVERRTLTTLQGMQLAARHAAEEQLELPFESMQSTSVH